MSKSSQSCITSEYQSKAIFEFAICIKCHVLKDGFKQNSSSSKERCKSPLNNLKAITIVESFEALSEWSSCYILARHPLLRKQLVVPLNPP